MRALSTSFKSSEIRTRKLKGDDLQPTRGDEVHPSKMFGVNSWTVVGPGNEPMTLNPRNVSRRGGDRKEGHPT